jgi:phospholipid/cholesterol/gamma-HCH transport system substrate-binding protein
MSKFRPWAKRATLLVALVPITACQFTGVNSIALPFSKGGRSDDIHITVEMESVANLVPNSEVKVDDVTVGSVRKIEVDGWHAKVTLGIEKGTKLPSNMHAAVAQKSLLGAEYIELSTPPDPSPNLLKSGDVIPIADTSRYPETEEVLSAVGMVLNGGGLSQIQTITHELNLTLGGHEADIRAFIKQFGALTGNLAAQKKNIVKAIDSLDHLSSRYAAGNQQIKTALDDLPAGVDVLAQERGNLTKMLSSLGDLGDQVSTIAKEDGTNLREDAKHLATTLDAIANTGPKTFQTALGSITYPFPIKSVIGGLRGDYLNLFFTVDLSLKSLERDYLSGTPLAGLYSTLVGLIPGSASKPTANPLLNPLQGLSTLLAQGTKTGSSKGATTGTPSPGAPSPSASPTTTPSGGSGLGGLLSALLGGGH